MADKRQGVFALQLPLSRGLAMARQPAAAPSAQTLRGAVLRIMQMNRGARPHGHALPRSLTRLLQGLGGCVRSRFVARTGD